MAPLVTGSLYKSLMSRVCCAFNYNVIMLTVFVGAQCITFWDDLGREVSSVQVGMWMLVTNVSVFSHDAFFYLSARQDTRSKFQIGEMVVEMKFEG